MNATTLKALALDALYQVLDNKVFRILLVLVLIPVLGTLLFGFREDEIVFLFGVKSWSYDGLVEFMSAVVGTRFGMEDPQVVVINGFSSLIVEFLAGSIGVMFTISATSFFVPRMIEKGAADVLFHKPVARLWLYLSRYFAGLVFIAMFAVALVGGMYIGFVLVSGYNDPGMLWAALTLTYLFALVHGISMMIGVFTRSTVAAIMLTIMFFTMNGCVHGAWIEFEQADARDRAELAAEAAENEDIEVVEPDDDWGAGRIFRTIISTLHYLGPKTTDADYITARLRAAVEGSDAFNDSESGFAVLELVPGLASADIGQASEPLPGAREFLGTPAYHAAGVDRAFTIWIRELRMIERSSVGNVRRVKETARTMASGFEDALGVGLELADERFRLGGFGRRSGMTPLFLSLRAERLRWSEGDRDHALVFTALGDHAITLAFEGPAGTLPEEVDPDEDDPAVAIVTEPGTEPESVSEAAEPDDMPAGKSWDRLLLEEAGFPYEAASTGWYGKQLGWTSPLKYNLFFSIGSSLAFVLVMLLLGWWRLSRIDF